MTIEPVSGGGKNEVLKYWSQTCALLATFVGCTVLFGWLMQLHSIIEPFSNMATTKANATLGIMLAGIAQLLMLMGKRRASQLTAFCVALIGILTLIEWHGHIDLGIDQLLCRDISIPHQSVNPPRMGPGVPGRMGPNTAQCLTLLGFGLITLQYGRRIRLLGYSLTTMTLLISLLSIVGNIYRVPRVLSIQSFTEMAPLTGLMLLVLSFGSLCAYPQYGLMAVMASDTAGGLAARRFLPACIIAPIAVGWLSLRGQEEGFYPPAFTAALLIVFMVIFLTLLIWWVAHSLKEEDEARKLARERKVAADRAQSESQFKSDFLANMSHEIRSPMNGILGMTGILLNSGLNERQMGYANIVSEAGKSLLTVINDILDFSKIEAGKLVIEKVDFNPIKLVEGVADILATQAADKNLLLLTYIDPQIPLSLTSDAGRLRQILTNLLSNAIKFTDEGEIVVRAVLQQKNEKMATLKFTVTDTGIGMSESELGQLFQPFVQVASASGRPGGTGLGLSICKRLVELLGGTIGVQSEPGKGTTFWFTMSLPVGDMPVDTVPSFQKLNGTRVLLVCDQPSTVEIYQEYLNFRGATYSKAQNIEQGQQMLGQAKGEDAYGIVLLDLPQQQEYGFNLVQAIRKDAVLNQTKIIVVLDFDKSDEGEKALQLGAEAYLTKPIKQTQLIDCIAAVRSGQGNRREKSKLSTTRNRIIEAPKRREIILIVDDREINQVVAQLQLKSLGFKSELAHDGQEAINMIQLKDYSLILMDCQMPILDGYQATVEIRKLEAANGKHVPIIAMTAHTVEANRQRCLEAGMDDYMSKPVMLDQLEQALEKWLPAVEEDNEPGDATAINVAQLKPVNEDPQAAASVTSDALKNSKSASQQLQENYGSSAFEIAELFLEGITEQKEALRGAFQSRQMAALLRANHIIKGTAASVYANEIVQLCLAVEEAGKQDDWASLAKLVDQCQETIDAVSEQLRAIPAPPA